MESPAVFLCTQKLIYEHCVLFLFLAGYIFYALNMSTVKSLLELLFLSKNIYLKTEKSENKHQLSKQSLFYH